MKYCLIIKEKKQSIKMLLIIQTVILKRVFTYAQLDVGRAENSGEDIKVEFSK